MSEELTPNTPEIDPKSNPRGWLENLDAQVASGEVSQVEAMERYIKFVEEITGEGYGL